MARFSLEPRAHRAGDLELHCGGMLLVQGPWARLLFRPGTDGAAASRAEAIVTEGACEPDPPRVVMPARVVRTSNHPSPHAWVDFEDATGRPLCSPLCIGRIERKVLRGEREFVASVSMNVWLAIRDLNPRRGPVLEITGDLVFPMGVEFAIRLGSEFDRHGGPAGRVEGAHIPILAPGASLPITRREMTPGAAGNEEVSLLMRDGRGMATGAEIAVGRCARLH